MNPPGESEGQRPDAIDELLRRRFAVPTDLRGRAATMVLTVVQGPATPRRWWPWWLAAAAAAVWVLSAIPSRPPSQVPHRLATEALMADASAAFPPTLVSCSTGPVPPPPTLQACIGAPPLPYLPGIDEQLVGPLTCQALPEAHRYWSRNPDNTVLLLVLPAADLRPIEWSGPPVATVERQTGGLRVVFVSTVGPAAAEQRAARLR